MRQDEHLRRQVRAAAQELPEGGLFRIPGQKGEAPALKNETQHQPVVA